MPFYSLRFNSVGSLVCAVLLVLGSATGCGNDEADPSSAEESSVNTAVPDTASLESVLRTDDRFTTLATAVDSAGVDSLLRADGPFTLFAPTNAAFAKLPEGTVDDLLSEQQDRLRAILTYHLVKGRLSATDLGTRDSVQTAAGSYVPVGMDGGTLLVQDIPVLTANVETANGLIHVLPQVLLPPEE